MTKPLGLRGSQAHSVDHLAHPSGNSTDTGGFRSLVPLKALPDKHMLHRFATFVACAWIACSESCCGRGWTCQGSSYSH
jgi:hypothetical protein